jgi:hypothetical protein
MVVTLTGFLTSLRRSGSFFTLERSFKKDGVFSSLPEVIDMLANHVLCALVYAINLKFNAQPSLK